MHSESPRNHNLSRATPAAERLRTDERANLEAITAPFNSDRGVDILFDGVTHGLPHSKDTLTVPSDIFHLM